MANHPSSLLNQANWNLLYYCKRPEVDDRPFDDVPTCRILFCRLLLDLLPRHPKDHIADTALCHRILQAWRKLVSRALVKSVCKFAHVPVADPVAFEQHAVARCSQQLGDRFEPRYSGGDVVIVNARALSKRTREAVEGAIARLRRADARWLQLVDECALDGSGWLAGALWVLADSARVSIGFLDPNPRRTLNRSTESQQLVLPFRRSLRDAPPQRCRGDANNSR